MHRGRRTLALRTLPRPRRWLLTVVHSRVAKVLTFAPLAFPLYVLSPWALYFTGWYDATLSSNLLHEVKHFHLVLIGPRSSRRSSAGPGLRAGSGDTPVSR